MLNDFGTGIIILSYQFWDCPLYSWLLTQNRERIPWKGEFTIRNDPWTGLIASCGSFYSMIRLFWTAETIFLNENKTLFRQPVTLSWVARQTLWLVNVVWPINAQISAVSTGARVDTCPLPRTCTVTAITRADTPGPRVGHQTRGDLVDSIWSLRGKGQYWQ